MADGHAKSRNSVDRQADLFRLADARHGLSRATLATLTGIAPSTLKGWANGAAMPAWALGALGEAGVPDELLTMVLAPFRRNVGTDEGERNALRELAVESAGFASKYLHANEDGKITPTEEAELLEAADRLHAVTRRARA